MYFSRAVRCIAFGILKSSRSNELETAALLHLKYVLGTGVNTKDKDRVSHDDYGHWRMGALYIVSVVTSITTQAMFKDIYISTYLWKKNGGIGLIQQYAAGPTPIGS